MNRPLVLVEYYKLTRRCFRQRNLADYLTAADIWEEIMKTPWRKKR